MAERDAAAEAPPRRRLDLTMAQVAASALAAVVGAVLASELGVYGTIGGAAVVSIGATVGGAFFQHLFRRTGEQLRERATEPLPVPAQSGPVPFDPFDPGGEHTRMMARIAPPERTESVTVYHGRRRLRPRSWKVLALSSVLVFALAMGTVTMVELAAGKPLADVVQHRSGTGTTFGGEGGSGTAGGGGGGAAPEQRQTATTSPTAGTRQRDSGAPASTSATDGRSTATATATAPATASPKPAPTPSRSTGPSGGPSTTPGSTPPTTSAPTPSSEAGTP